MRTQAYRQNRVFNTYSKRTPLLYPVLLMGLKGSLWYYLNHFQSFLKGGPIKILSHQITLVLSRFNVDQFTLATSRRGGLVERLVNDANGCPMRSWQAPQRGTVALSNYRDGSGIVLVHHDVNGFLQNSLPQLLQWQHLVPHVRGQRNELRFGGVKGCAFMLFAAEK